MQSKATVTQAVVTLAATAPPLTARYASPGAGGDLQAAGTGISDTANNVTGYKP